MARTFGTIDREHVSSAGAVGFAASHPKLVEWHWREADREMGHRGNHVAYLGRRWQEAVLMPAIDPDIDAAALASAWATRHEEP